MMVRFSKVKSVANTLITTIHKKKYWTGAIVLVCLNFLIMYFGPLRRVYITPSRNWPILFPAGLVYAMLPLSIFVTVKELATNKTVGFLSLIIFSLISRFYLYFFINDKILPFLGLIFMTLAFNPIKKVSQSMGENGWAWLSLCTLLILFTHAGTAILYLFSLLFFLINLSYSTRRKEILNKSLLYIGPVIILWLVSLLFFRFETSSLALTQSNAILELKRGLTGSLSSIKIQFIVMGGLLASFFYLCDSYNQKERNGLKILLLWLSSTLLLGGVTYFLPWEGTVNNFLYFLLLLLIFLFSYTLTGTLKSITGKKKIDTRIGETVIDELSVKALPLLILALFLSLSLLTFHFKDFSSPRMVRGNKFHDSTFPEENKPNIEDPQLGFGEDFSNISEWTIKGDHKKPPEIREGKVRLWAQDDGDTSWDFAQMVYRFGQEGFNTSLHPILGIRITNFTETGEGGHFKVGIWDQERYKDLPLVVNEEEAPDTLFLNLHEFGKNHSIGPIINGIKLLTVIKENKNEAMTEIDWLRIYGLKEYVYSATHLSGGWRSWINSHTLSSDGGNLIMTTEFRSPNTQEAIGIRMENLKVSTKYYIAIKYKTSNKNTGVSLDLNTNEGARKELLSASTDWRIYRSKLSNGNEHILNAFSIHLLDDWKSVPSLTGDHELYIDWIKIGLPGKVIIAG